MKRLLGCLMMAVLVFTACEGPMGPAGRDGRDGESTQWFVKDYNILSNQWKSGIEKGDGYSFRYFEYEISIPQLTNFVFDEGFVGCYLVQEMYENGSRYLLQRPLPYTIYGYDKDGFQYSENYSFEIRPGYINFIVKYSDFETADVQPLSCTFHVVMMW